MQKNSKKEIRQIVEETLMLTLVRLKIGGPSKKIKKGLAKTSKDLARLLKEEMKKEAKLHAKSLKAKKGKKISKAPLGKSKGKISTKK